MLEVLPVHLLREVKPFIIWFYPPLLDYDVSMDEVVELVVVIPTSPRSSKTESECKNYHRFHVEDSFRPDYPPKFGPDYPPPPSNFWWFAPSIRGIFLGGFFPRGWIIRPKNPATAIFCGGGYKRSLLLPCTIGYSLSLFSIFDLE
jgi:hypothetical protein